VPGGGAKNPGWPTFVQHNPAPDVVTECFCSAGLQAMDDFLLVENLDGSGSSAPAKGFVALMGRVS